jgi:FG-GAP-like repeat
MTLAPRTATRVAIGSLALASLAFLSGCEDVFGASPPHAAPSNPTAEAGDGFVELDWGPVAEADSYVIRWTDGAGGLVNEISGITETEYLHSDLTNLAQHRYRIAGETSGGVGPESREVAATPGPVPGPVEWAVVITKDPGHEIYFAPAEGATDYRAYNGPSEASLAGRRPFAGFFEGDDSPILREEISVRTPAYYRVIAMNDSRIGFGGPVIVSSTPVIVNLDLPRLGNAIGDTNGDGCLDLLGAVQTRSGTICTGPFTPRNMNDAGLGNLVAEGRINGDSRFVDLNGDGRDDLFSTTATPAPRAASIALAHLGQENGNFQSVPGVAALGIGGFGGTLLAADFDNDGDIDLFLPYDQTRGDGARNWLLLNDGAAAFTDAAAAAGVAIDPPGAAYVPRGGQAADFDEDGFVDLLFGSRLMRNNGDGTFSDASIAAGIPVLADEGLRLIDADLDGDLDLVHHDGAVTRLHRNEAGVFGSAETLFEDTTQATIGRGLNVCDFNGDGFEDIVVANNAVATGKGVPKLLVNINGEFMPSALPAGTAADEDSFVAKNDLVACADFDQNGVADMVARWGINYRTLRAANLLSTRIRIRVLDAAGHRDQQGRIVRIVPRSAPERIMTRVVDSGSGLQSQNQYDLLVGAPWPGRYDISVRFADGVVNATADPGDDLRIFADGRVEDGLEDPEEP